MKKVRIGRDMWGVTVRASSIGQLQVSEDINDSTVGVTGDLGMLRGDSSLGLSLRVGGSLGTVRMNRDLDSALVSVLKDVGQIRVGGDVNRSTVMAGVDVGEDFEIGTADDVEWGDLRLEKVTVRGDMIDTSIAAGVGTGEASYSYGDGDDVSTVNHIGTARIYRIVVRGEIGSSGVAGETYAISADDGIDLLRSRGKAFTGAPGVVVQEF